MARYEFLENKLPLNIGGGIGQGKEYMFLFQRKNITQVRSF